MKKRNEDDPNIHHEPSDLLPADFLTMINEVLERLHGWENLNIIKFKNYKM